jgi:hypothetical protein
MTTEDIILEIERIRKIYVEAYPYWTEKGDHALIYLVEKLKEDIVEYSM